MFLYSGHRFISWYVPLLPPINQFIKTTNMKTYINNDSSHHATRDLLHHLECISKIDEACSCKEIREPVVTRPFHVHVWAWISLDAFDVRKVRTVLPYTIAFGNVTNWIPWAVEWNEWSEKKSWKRALNTSGMCHQDGNIKLTPEAIAVGENAPEEFPC